VRAGPRPATAVLVTLLVAVLAACGDDSEPTGAPSADASTTSSDPTSSAPTSDPADTGAPADEAAAMAVVDEWIASIGTGDTELVESGLGPTSRAAIEAMGGMESIMSGLAEGMAAFGQPGLERAAVALPGHEGAWLVTYHGEVSSEGQTGYDAHSWLVVPGADGADVEAFAQPLPEVLAPADRTAARTDEMVTVTLPAGGQVLALLDGTTVLPGSLVEPADGDQVRISAAPEDGLPTGSHTITVAVVPEAGAGTAWATTAVAFTVV